MQIEVYKTPYDQSGKVAASKWISYVLRPAETGLVCPTAIMIDPVFEQAIADLRTKQIADFHASRSPKSLEMWRNRVIPEDDPSMTKKERETYKRQRVERNRILAQEANVNDAGPIGFIRNNDTATKMQRLVHDLMLTQKYNLTSGASAGKMFQHQFDKAILTDPDAVAKISAAMKAVRDCFPPNMPVMLSFHLDKKQDNPHIHGWLSDRVWDSANSTWGEVSPMTTTVKGMSELRKKIDQAVLSSTGMTFGNQAKKLDPLRPKRDMFTKRQAYWTQKYRGRQDEFLKGDFLSEISNQYEREAMRQFVAQRRYDVEMMQKANLLKQEKAEHRQQLSQIRTTQKGARQERRVLYRTVEEMAMLMESANNPSAELQKMHPPKPGTTPFTPVTGYYRTKQYHRKLSTNVRSLYDGYSESAKALEVKSIRDSVSRIDKQLSNPALSATQRTNLEFTRDFEIKSLKYLKAQLPETPKTEARVAAPAKVSVPTEAVKERTPETGRVIPKL